MGAGVKVEKRSWKGVPRVLQQAIGNRAGIEKALLEGGVGGLFSARLVDLFDHLKR
jgi:hypothetical protein